MGYDMYRLNPNGEEVEVTPETFASDVYHRLNVWGMGDARAELMKVGVIRDGPFPDPPASDDDVEAWRTASDGDGPGIPVHKFCTNDGWVVNPTEVRSGIKYADEHHPGWRKTLEPHVADFVTWMEGSDAGFEVW